MNEYVEYLKSSARASGMLDMISEIEDKYAEGEKVFEL